MFKSLQELRSQREAIQSHLNWLDAQIKHLEIEKDSKSDANKHSPKAQSETEDHSYPSNKNSLPTHAESELQSNHATEDTLVKSSSTSDVKRAQVGCFLIFIFATLLFLFLLFGLPYLLD